MQREVLRGQRVQAAPVYLRGLVGRPGPARGRDRPPDPSSAGGCDNGHRCCGLRGRRCGGGAVLGWLVAGRRRQHNRRR